MKAAITNFSTPGQAEVELSPGEVIDLRKELFVLRRSPDGFKYSETYGQDAPRMLVGRLEVAHPGPGEQDVSLTIYPTEAGDLQTRMLSSSNRFPSLAQLLAELNRAKPSA